jgi:hypothetical protein
MSRVKSLPAFVLAAVRVGPASVYGFVWLLDGLGIDTDGLPIAIAVLLVAAVPSLCIYLLGRAMQRTTGQIVVTAVVVVPLAVAALALLVVIALSNADLN